MEKVTRLEKAGNLTVKKSGAEAGPGPGKWLESRLAPPYGQDGKDSELTLETGRKGTGTIRSSVTTPPPQKKNSRKLVTS